MRIETIPKGRGWRAIWDCSACGYRLRLLYKGRRPSSVPQRRIPPGARDCDRLLVEKVMGG